MHLAHTHQPSGGVGKMDVELGKALLSVLMFFFAEGGWVEIWSAPDWCFAGWHACGCNVEGPGNHLSLHHKRTCIVRMSGSIKIHFRKMMQTREKDICAASEVRASVYSLTTPTGVKLLGILFTVLFLTSVRLCGQCFFGWWRLRFEGAWTEMQCLNMDKTIAPMLGSGVLLACISDRDASFHFAGSRLNYSSVRSRSLPWKLLSMGNLQQPAETLRPFASPLAMRKHEFFDSSFLKIVWICESCHSVKHPAKGLWGESFVWRGCPGDPQPCYIETDGDEKQIEEPCRRCGHPRSLHEAHIGQNRNVHRASLSAIGVSGRLARAGQQGQQASKSNSRSLQNLAGSALLYADVYRIDTVWADKYT